MDQLQLLYGSFTLFTDLEESGYQPKKAGDGAIVAAYFEGGSVVCKEATSFEHLASIGRRGQAHSSGRTNRSMIRYGGFSHEK